MPSKATIITVTEDERSLLERVVRTRTAPAREVLRARIILAASAGERNDEIARRLGVSTNVVSRWRRRFAKDGVAGLQERPRSGRPERYGEATERQVLAKLEEPPPSGWARWNGRLLARALGLHPATSGGCWRNTGSACSGAAPGV